MNFLREPLLQFFLIGLSIFILYSIFAEPGAEDEGLIITVNAGEIEWMINSWKNRWNRPPTEEELESLVQQYIKETILYREALEMGLNQHDRVIRRRLAQKMEFLAKDLATITPPSEEELRSYFEKYKAQYLLPRRYTFTQVYFDPDLRGDATLDDAEMVKQKLVKEGDSIADPGSLGDNIMLQSYNPNKEPIEIQKMFGSGFRESLEMLEPGKWHGPVLSGYGAHLVYISHVSESHPPKFDQLREQVTQDWTANRSEEFNQEFYNALREKYTVVTEELEPYLNKLNMTGQSLP